MRCRQEFSFRASCSFGFSLTKVMIEYLHSKLYFKSMPIEIFKKQSRRHVTLSGEVPGVSRVVVLLGPKSSADPSLCSPKFEPFAVPFCSSLEFFAYPHSSLERNPYHESSSLASLISSLIHNCSDSCFHSYLIFQPEEIQAISKAKQTQYDPSTIDRTGGF